MTIIDYNLNALRQRVSESLFWEALPLSELLEECEMRGVSLSDRDRQADEDARTHVGS